MTDTHALPSADEYVFIDKGDTKIEGIVVSATQTTITLTDWTLWNRGNRPTNGAQGDERAVPITEATHIWRAPNATPIRRETAGNDPTAMTGPEHYRAAEGLLARVTASDGDLVLGEHTMIFAAVAQVHATLALADATRRDQAALSEDQIAAAMNRGIERFSPRG